MYWESSGCVYGGDFSAAQMLLRRPDVDHVILGHSERRHPGSKSQIDAVVKRKAARAALQCRVSTHRLCIGETELERKGAGSYLVVSSRRQLVKDVPGMVLSRSRASQASHGVGLRTCLGHWNRENGHSEIRPRKPTPLCAGSSESVHYSGRGSRWLKDLRILYGGSVKARDNAGRSDGLVPMWMVLW